MLIPHSSSDSDGFSRLLPPCTLFGGVPLQVWLDLVQAMRGIAQRNSGVDSPKLAGYTYLGQLISHDLSLDESPLATLTPDSARLRNGRTPKLDLDTLYGRGPWDDASRHLYERDIYFRLAEPLATFRVVDFKNVAGRLLVADERTHDNLILRELLLAFAKLHNAAVDQLRSPALDEPALFSAARRQVTTQYQFLVREEWLRQVIDLRVYERVCLQSRRQIDWPQFSVPIEYSHAAMRFGHSLVRARYIIHLRGGAHEATLDDIFRRSRDLRPLEADWVIDWDEYFSGRGMTFNAIDTFIVPPLVDLAGPPFPLPAMTLLRGAKLQLTSGQVAAKAFGEVPLTWADLFENVDFPEPTRGLIERQGRILQEAGMVEETPLWYYVLRESSVIHNGNRLGPTGSHIVAETIEAALLNDLDSYLHIPNFKLPIWRGRTERFGSMGVLLNYASQL